MNRIDKQEIWNYCIAHSTSESELLTALERETYLKTLAPQMISEALLGRLISFLSKMIAPHQILEVGTFTGYGTLCLAEGLSPNGRIHTIEINKELKHISDKYFEMSAFANAIISHQGDALQLIPSMDVIFDLAYIDAGKLNNWKFVELILPKLSVGGILLVDNTLWSGKVIGNSQDKVTLSIQAFNKQVQEHPEIENVILPIRDGLTILRKK